jgi:molybdate transport system ATP-binding protein
MLSVKIKKRLAGLAGNSPAQGAIDHEFTLDVEFNVPVGITILFGASGSGKSMTLKSIAGIVRPDSGRISVGGRVLFDSERGINLPIRERCAGYVFQSLALLPHLSALGNVEFAIKTLPRRERRERALALMQSFGIEHTASRRPSEISGGEAQRVALARALAGRPQLLLLDEPLSALDDAIKLEIIADLKKINRDLRLPVVYVTHSREEAVTLGEHAIIYEHGRVIAAGEPLEVFGAPVKASVARLTGVENVFEGRVVSKSEAAGTMSVSIGEETAPCHVDVPLGGQIVGEIVTVAVRSGDILLATEEPRSTSARNILRGRITKIEERNDQILVDVSCSGIRWVVSVTRQAARELILSTEREVWLAIKTYSCHLLDRRP